MNMNRRVLYLVLLFVGLLILVSVSQYIFALTWQPLRRINLVDNILRKPPPAVAAKPVRKPFAAKNGTQTSFDLFQQAHLITNFKADTSQAALMALMGKLYGLKTGKKEKVRIAYLGDSMIEADLITETLRKLLQREFGGEGVGFVPVASPSSKIRTTIHHTYGNWQEDNFKSAAGNHRLYLSGHVFHGTGAWINLTDETIADSATAIEKSLLCGHLDTKVVVTVADSLQTIEPAAAVNRIPLRNDPAHTISLRTSAGQLPLYGLSFESASGVFVDNFSFRGVSGVEFASIDSAFLHAIAVNNPYDLIIMQYGINQMFDPDAINYSWYHKIMTPSIRNLKRAFAGSDFLLISTADRAFRYGDEYKTAIGIDSLIKVQASLAYENKLGFYNLYQSMGGSGTIVAWANADPALANKDYVHPNRRGAEIIGEDLFKALMHDFRKYKPVP